MSPDFLADFNRARSNGYLAQQAGLAFNPVFNPAVPGSAPDRAAVVRHQPAHQRTVVSNLQTNQAAALADFYMTSRVAGSLATFMPNPAIYASQGLSNGGFSDYNALQIELRRQFRNGFLGQINYTLSNTKTDSSGTAQNRFEAFMDNAAAGLNTGRSVFHVTHVVSANAIYELPFGQRQAMAQFARPDRCRSSAAGRSGRSSPGRADRRSASSRAAARSTAPAARTAQRPDQLQHRVHDAVRREIKNLLGIFKQPTGRSTGSTRRSSTPPPAAPSGADNLGNTARFDGQVFFNPAAGSVGNLPILAFDGPPQFRVDLALSKRFRLTDRYRLRDQGRGVQPDQHAELLPRRHGRQQHDVRPADDGQRQLAGRPAVGEVRVLADHQAAWGRSRIPGRPAAPDHTCAPRSKVGV